MAKAKESVEVRNALTAAEYWEWRTTIAEMNVATEKLKLAVSEAKVMDRDTELSSMRSLLFKKTRIEACKSDAENTAKEYERIKEQLEKSLGISLSGKLIDDVTFEVKDLPQDNK